MAGELDVEAMLRRRTAKWFRDWEIYHELEPFGEIRADYRIATLVQMLYNVNRGPKQKALPLEDFLLKFEAQEQKPRPKQDQFALMKLLAEAYSQPTVEVHDDSTATADMFAQVARARAAMKES